MEPFIGQICLFGFNYAPRGWALCNGQLLSISENSTLFALIGTRFGGDGRSTFALPDLRGRVPVSMGAGPGRNPVQLGEFGGANATQLAAANLPAHHHDLDNIGIGYNEEGKGEGGSTLTDLSFNEEDLEEQVNLTNNKTGDTGSGHAFNNMQPYIGLNFCIALVGLFPSRS